MPLGNVPCVVFIFLKREFCMKEFLIKKIQEIS